MVSILLQVTVIWLMGPPSDLGPALFGLHSISYAWFSAVMPPPPSLYAHDSKRCLHGIFCSHLLFWANITLKWSLSINTFRTSMAKPSYSIFLQSLNPFWTPQEPRFQENDIPISLRKLTNLKLPYPRHQRATGGKTSFHLYNGYMSTIYAPTYFPYVLGT